jgi:hypothetical protein
MNFGPTYINFAYCELEGKWQRINEEMSSNVDIYEALEDNSQINVRIFDDKKKNYRLKKGAKILIYNHILKLNKEDFAK